jgi:DNA-binding MarR family transcriptional regulator
MVRFDEAFRLSKNATHERRPLAVLRGYPQISRLPRDFTRARSNPHGLSARDASILAHLSRSEPLRASELARHLGVGASTLSAALATLEALGYLAREQDPSDRRVQRIRLAERGEIAMAASSVLDPARVTSLLERLDENERRRAIDGLDLLARAARELGGVVHDEATP